MKIVMQTNRNIPIPTKGIVVDGSCRSNPGPIEYRGADLETGELLFHVSYQIATNNIAEFLAIAHAMKWCKENNRHASIYSDSMTALYWISAGRANTNLDLTPAMERCLNGASDFIRESKDLKVTVYKWDTKSWGEIPADFGYKCYKSRPKNKKAA